VSESKVHLPGALRLPPAARAPPQVFLRGRAPRPAREVMQPRVKPSSREGGLLRWSARTACLRPALARLAGSAPNTRSLRRRSALTGQSARKRSSHPVYRDSRRQSRSNTGTPRTMLKRSTRTAECTPYSAATYSMPVWGSSESTSRPRPTVYKFVACMVSKSMSKSCDSPHGRRTTAGGLCRWTGHAGDNTRVRPSGRQPYRSVVHARWSLAR
jgi:hypothetical protein